MDTFWGCTPQQLIELAERLRTAADALERMLERIVIIAESTRWTGPDADAHRARTENAALAAADLAAAVRRLGIQLRGEAREQEQASAPDRVPAVDPFELLRAGLPAPGELRETMRRIGDEVRDILLPPGTLRRRAADRITDLDLLPWIAGPLQKPLDLDVLRAPQTPPAPAEPLEPDAASQAWAEQTRRKLARSNPFTKAAQTLMSVHEALDAGHTALEQKAQGDDVAEAVVAGIGIPLHIGGTVLGERSPLGQIQRGVDDLLASQHQTAMDVKEAIAERDAAAVLRAAERNAYRSAEAIGTVALSSPLPATISLVDDLAAAGAELLDPLAPEAADRLRTGVEDTRSRAEDMSETIGLDDPAGSLYETRRRHLSMPWDEAA